MLHPTSAQASMLESYASGSAIDSSSVDAWAEVRLTRVERLYKSEIYFMFSLSCAALSSDQCRGRNSPNKKAGADSAYNKLMENGDRQ
jgi:hypothetical protein